MVRKLAKMILRYRVFLIIFIVLATAFFFYEMCKIEFATSFADLLPQNHPYVKVHNEFRSIFGGANVISIAVQVKEGNIFNTETLRKIKRITEEMNKFDGVNHYQILSLAHGKLRHIECTAWGIESRPIMHPFVPETQAGLRKLQNIVRQDDAVYGSLVSFDYKSALIEAAFIEGRLNYAKLFDNIREIVEREEDSNTKIYVTGQPMLYGWVYHYNRQVFAILLITSIVVLALIYLYIRTFGGMLVPLSSIVVGIIWGLGFAGLLGINLDPLIVVVPFLICARAASHSVQMVQRYNEEYARLGDVNRAVEEAFVGLFPPGILSMITDAAGVLIIGIAPIPLMQKLAFIGSFWVISLVVGGFICDPIILSYLPSPKRVVERFEKRTSVLDRALTKIGNWCYGRGKLGILAVAVVLVAFGVFYTTRLTIGDVRSGSPVLWSDSDFNISAGVIAKNLVGEDRLVIVVEGEKTDIIKLPKVLNGMEAFQRHMELGPDVVATRSVVDVIKGMRAVFHESDPKWRMIPRDWVTIGQYFFYFLTGSQPGDLDRYADPGFRTSNITVFYRDHKAGTIKRAIERANEYIASHQIPEVKYRLAGGLVGVLGATNEAIAWSQRWNLIAIFSVIFVFCAIVYRSFFAGFLFVVSLAIANLLAFAFLGVRGIGLNINTLPVSALAIGLGVDYGLYIISRMREQFRISKDLKDATITTILGPGKAVLITATTLVIGVVLWSFSPLRFQAEMGLLLALLMFMNMLGGIILLPTIVNLFKPKFVVQAGLPTRQK